MIHVSLLIHPEVSVGPLSRLSHQLRPHLAPLWETYGTEALRLSPALTSKDWQRCPTHFPYSKFFSLLSLPSVLFFSSCQGLVFTHTGSRAFCSSLSCWLWQVDLQCQSPLSSPDRAPGSVQGAGDIIHHCSHLSHFGAMLRSDCWTTQLPWVFFTASFTSHLPSFTFTSRKSGIRSFCLKGIISCSSDTRRKG